MGALVEDQIRATLEALVHHDAVPPSPRFRGRRAFDRQYLKQRGI
jgi:hypothetical protein